MAGVTTSVPLTHVHPLAASTVLPNPIQNVARKRALHIWKEGSWHGKPVTMQGRTPKITNRTF